MLDKIRDDEDDVDGDWMNIDIDVGVDGDDNDNNSIHDRHAPIRHWLIFGWPIIGA